MWIGGVAHGFEAQSPIAIIVGAKAKQAAIARPRFQQLAMRPKTFPRIIKFQEKILVRIVRKVATMAFCASVRKAFHTKMIVVFDRKFAISGVAFYQALRKRNTCRYPELTHFGLRDFRETIDVDRKSTRLNSSHRNTSRMPSSA